MIMLTLDGAKYVQCMGWKSFCYFCLCCSDTEGVEAARTFFEGHANFGIKSPTWALELIHYISEGPEWSSDEEFWEGKWPEKTGGAVFTLESMKQKRA